MKIKNKKIALCIPEIPVNNKELLVQIKDLKDAIIIPIIDDFNISYRKNGKYKKFSKEIQSITSNQIIHTEEMAENIGRKNIFDITLMLPCNENIIPKLANNIFDSPTMKIIKYQLINDKPVVLGIYANNALSSNAENIGKLLNQKCYYFIPFRQSNPITKPYLITYDYKYIYKTLESSLSQKQIQPIILSL